MYLHELYSRWAHPLTTSIRHYDCGGRLSPYQDGVTFRSVFEDTVTRKGRNIVRNMSGSASSSMRTASMHTMSRPAIGSHKSVWARRFIKTERRLSAQSLAP